MASLDGEERATKRPSELEAMVHADSSSKMLTGGELGRRN